MKFCSVKQIKGILLPHAPHTLDLFAGYMDSKVFYFWGPLQTMKSQNVLGTISREAICQPYSANEVFLPPVTQTNHSRLRVFYCFGQGQDPPSGGTPEMSKTQETICFTCIWLYL